MTSWWFFPTHLKNMRKSNWVHLFPTNRDENNTYLSCHHHVIPLKVNIFLGNRRLSDSSKYIGDKKERVTAWITWWPEVFVFGGWTHPSKKHESNWIISLGRDWKKTTQFRHVFFCFSFAASGWVLTKHVHRQAPTFQPFLGPGDPESLKMCSF